MASKLPQPRHRGSSALVAPLLLALLLAAPGAQARVIVQGHFGAYGYPDFALHVYRRDYSVRYADEAVQRRLETDNYALSFFEPLSPNFKMGFIGGRNDVSQAGRPATAGTGLGGYFLALAGKAVVPLGERFQLRLAGSLGYHDADGRAGEQRTSIEWTEASAEADLVVALLPRLRLVLGQAWIDVDGDERTFGTFASNVDFEESGGTATRLGIELVVDRTGFIGITLQEGNPESLLVYFQRAFE